MVNKIISILLKNFQILIHSKSSSLIIILGPLLLILIAGSALTNTELKNINIGLFSENYNNLSSNLLQKLRDKQYEVKAYDSLARCIQSVKDEINHVCVDITKENIALPSRYQSENLGYKAVMHVDFSKQRIVWSIINSINSIIDSESDRTIDKILSDLSTGLNNSILELDKKLILLNQVIQKSESMSVAISEITQELNLYSLNPQDVKDITLLIATIQADVLSLPIGNSTYAAEQKYQIVRDLDEIYNNLKTLEDQISKYSETNKNAGQNIGDLQNQLKQRIQDLKKIQAELKQISQDLKDLQKVNFYTILDPIKREYKSISDEESSKQLSSEFNLLDYIYPSFLIIFISFTSVILSSLLVIKERVSRSNFRNTISPTSDLTYLIGTFLSCFFIIAFQAAIILFISNFFTHININEVITETIILSFISITVFVLTGMIIGFIFNSQDTAIMASVSVSIVFLLFSSLISPIETMSPIIAKIALFSPLVLFETMLRKVLIFHLSITSISKELIVAIILTISMSFIAYFSKKLTKYKELS